MRAVALWLLVVDGCSPINVPHHCIVVQRRAECYLLPDAMTKDFFSGGGKNVR
jgi:hypothetical protein